MGEKNVSLESFDLIQDLSVKVKQPQSNEKCFLSHFLIITFLLLIAAGIQISILLFIFAKRQLMKFKQLPLKNSKTSIEQSCKDIHKSIDAFYFNLSNFILSIEESGKTHKQYYRFKTVNDMKKLESQLMKLNKCKNTCKPFYKTKNVRRYLVENLSAFLDDSKQLVIHELCDIYEHARFNPSNFQKTDYNLFTKLLNKLLIDILDAKS